MGPFNEELPSWAAKRDDKHEEETKDKAESDAGYYKRAPRSTWSFPLVWTKERPRRKSTRKAAH